MAKPTDIHWIAGPIAYVDTTVTQAGGTLTVLLTWEFISGTANRRIRRWRLHYAIKDRKFTLSETICKEWDQKHADDLATLYRPIAVMRIDLPKRSNLAAIRALLPEKEIATATALSIRGGRR